MIINPADNILIIEITILFPDIFPRNNPKTTNKEKEVIRDNKKAKWYNGKKIPMIKGIIHMNPNRPGEIPLIMAAILLANL